MRKIIICGNASYVNQITKAIQSAAERFKVTTPAIVGEAENSEHLLGLAKTEPFPLFILDRNLPSPKRNWFVEDALCLSSSIRRARKESVENYGDTSDGKAIIIIHSTTGYSMSDRGAMDRFWSPSMYLTRNVQSTDEQIAELAVGTNVFNDAWALPAIWATLQTKFSSGAR